MPITFASLVDDEGWVPMPLNQQGHPNYLWQDGRLLADAPVDFAATFDGAMWVTGKPIDVPAFYRNPLRVRAGFMVPRHHHNIDETVFVLAGEYRIEYGDVDHPESVLVRPGGFFTSRAGTPYTMIAGPRASPTSKPGPSPSPSSKPSGTTAAGSTANHTHHPKTEIHNRPIERSLTPPGPFQLLLAKVGPCAVRPGPSIADIKAAAQAGDDARFRQCLVSRPVRRASAMSTLTPGCSSRRLNPAHLTQLGVTEDGCQG